jgi:beta-glucosidase
MDSIAAGKIDEKIIDEKVKRILRVMFAVKSIHPEGRAKGSINTEEHTDIAYKIASESIILLKNSENRLPVNTSKIKSIAVIGDNATRKHASGGFGAGVKTKNEITPLQGLKNKLPAGVAIHYAQGYKENYTDIDNKNSFGRSLSNEADPGLMAEAIAAARKSDVAIIFAGSNRTVESEAADRVNIDLPFGQEELIRKVQEANPNTIVVIIAGAPFDLKEVQKYASALVWSWFNGNEAGNALADVLLGNINPSGKLPWTLPKNLMDSPAHATLSFPGAESVTYKEGIFVGYRWFDAKNIEPLYPFGYGLSYTSFDFSDLKTDKQNYVQDESIQVSFSIKNTGITDGKEVAQLYVSQPGSTVEKADKELKAYKKVFVKSGATVNTTIGLPIKELAYYNDIKKEWIVEPGIYIIKIGKSSREIIAEISINIK